MSPEQLDRIVFPPVFVETLIENLSWEQALAMNRAAFSNIGDDMNRTTKQQKDGGEGAKKGNDEPEDTRPRVPLSPRSEKILARIRRRGESNAGCIARLIEEAKPGDFDLGEPLNS